MTRTPAERARASACREVNVERAPSSAPAEGSTLTASTADIRHDVANHTNFDIWTPSSGVDTRSQAPWQLIVKHSWRKFGLCAMPLPPLSSWVSHPRRSTHSQGLSPGSPTSLHIWLVSIRVSGGSRVSSLRSSTSVIDRLLIRRRSSPAGSGRRTAKKERAAPLGGTRCSPLRGAERNRQERNRQEASTGSTNGDLSRQARPTDCDSDRSD